MPRPWSAYGSARTAGVLLVTAFAGSAATNAVASRLLVSDEALAAAGVLEVEAPTAPERDEPDAKALAREQQLAAALEAQAEFEAERSAELIVAHNVFCPDCQPIPAVESNAELKPAMSPTELPLSLVATMESNDPLFSMATIRDTELESTGVFSVGDPVRPGVFVAGVKRGLVVLRSTAGMRTLVFTPVDQPKPKPKGKSKPKKEPKKGSREIPGAREAIECKGNACTVDRKFVERLMKNPRLLVRQAKLIPAVKDGETRGFRVHRVRTGTLPRLLGLQNGDTLLAVNGTDLDSMDQAMSLYVKLRRASELSLTVERKGKVFEKQISIR